MLMVCPWLQKFVYPWVDGAPHQWQIYFLGFLAGFETNYVHWLLTLWLQGMFM